MEFLKKGEIKSGDRIAFLAKNSSEFIELMYASSILELVMVPINFRLTYKEVKFIVQDSGSKNYYFLVKNLRKSLKNLIPIRPN